VIESLEEDTFLEESLFVVTLEVVDVLEFEPMFFSLSSEEDNAKTSRKAFLKIKMLLNKYLAMQQV